MTSLDFKVEEVNIYMSHGASYDLAEALSGLFHPITYSVPLAIELMNSSGSLESELRGKISQGELDGIAHYFLLIGNSATARAILDGSLRRWQNGRDFQDRQLVVDCITSVQAVVDATKDDFDKIRADGGYPKMEEDLDE